MMALLWKDWRLVRPLMIAAAVLYLAPWPIGGAFAAFSGGGLPRTGEEWFNTAAILCAFGVMTSALATPMFAAVMFARERRDRTAELVATMPVSRARVVASKALVGVGAAAAPWVLTLVMIPLLISLGGAKAQEDWGREFGDDAAALLIPLGILTLAFGVAWLFSAMLRSETGAAGIAYLVAIAVPVVIALVVYRLRPLEPARPEPYYLVSAPLGIACFLAGTVVAMVRVSP